MSDNVTQDRIRRALAGVLQPLARTLIRCGVSYTEFAELAKRAFVDAASQDYGVRNRPTNVARVAVMTGLSRKEVGRIRRSIVSDTDKFLSYRNLPAEVLHLWHTDPNFLDVAGHPRPLPFASPRRSFSSLVKSVTADIPPRTMLRELQRSGAITQIGSRSWRPLRREFVPSSVDEKVIEGIQYGLRRLAETVCFNAQPINRASGKFQRIVHTDSVPLSDVNVIRDSLAAILSGFATRMDDYLSTFRVKGKRKHSDSDFTMNVGVGLYYFDDCQ